MESSPALIGAKPAGFMFFLPAGRDSIERRGGCSFKYDFSYAPEKGQNIGNGKTVLVFEVADRRPEVVQGKEDPNWVGWQRSGFGIPFDITTSDGKPFAEKVTEVIIKDISSVGFVCKEKKLDELTKEKIGRAAKEANARRQFMC